MSVVIVHVLPLAAFETDRRFGSRELEAAFTKGKTMPAYSDGAWNFRFNFDGLAILDFTSPQQIASYLQVFRNGVIESVSTEPMASDRDLIFSAFFEGKLLQSLPNYLLALQALSVPSPVFIGLSLIGAERSRLPIPNHGFYRDRYSQPLGRQILIVPPIMLENYSANLAAAMRPVFDSVWNAAGEGESPYYDGDEWKGLKKFNAASSVW